MRRSASSNDTCLSVRIKGVRCGPKRSPLERLPPPPLAHPPSTGDEPRRRAGHAYGLITTTAVNACSTMSLGVTPGIPASPALILTGGLLQLAVVWLCIPLPFPFACENENSNVCVVKSGSTRRS
jgi:hypothetical protein